MSLRFLQNLQREVVPQLINSGVEMRMAIQGHSANIAGAVNLVLRALVTHNLIHDFTLGKMVNLRETLDLQTGKCTIDGTPLHMKEQHDLDGSSLKIQSEVFLIKANTK